MSRPQPTIAVKESRDDLLGIGPSTGLRGGYYGLVYVIGKGLYRWRSGDQSSNVPGSNDSDAWVAPSEDTSGKSGAWNLESPQVNDPEHATDSGTDTFVSATNTGTPGDGAKITRDFQSANTTTTPTLDGKTLTTKDGSALWAGAVSGVHELQYDSGADTYLVLEPNPSQERDLARLATASLRGDVAAFHDEDDMASDDASGVASQQSVKSYVDTQDATFEQQRAQAWVNFDGTGTVSIRDHYNVSSITDNGTGDYTVNFSSNLADANYAPIVSPIATSGQGGMLANIQDGSITVGSVSILTFARSDGTPTDSDVGSVTVLGGN